MKRLYFALGGLVLLYLDVYLTYLIAGGGNLARLPYERFRTAIPLQKWQVSRFSPFLPPANLGADPCNAIRQDTVYWSWSCCTDMLQLS